MRINQNITAFNAYRNLNNTQNSLSSSLEKLSSGFRINRAADDASGLVNSENLRSQIGGLKVATRNAQDAISLVQTAEGAQTEVHSILQRMRDLAVQSGNLGTNDGNALDANQAELVKLREELNRIGSETQFGTQKILNGDFDEASALTTATLDTTDGVTTGTNDVAVDLNGIAEAGSTGDEQGPADFVGRDVTLNFQDDTGPVVSVTFNYGASALEAAENFETAFGELTAAETAALDSATVSVDNGVVTVAAGGTSETLAFAGGEVAAAENTGAIFQVGANADQRVDVTIKSVQAADLGTASLKLNGIDIGDGVDEDGIDDSIAAIDAAISTVSENRSELGAFQNRMESTIRNLGVAVENLSAAESRIRDTDMAMEMTEFTRNQILSQAGTAMLAQANTVPQSVLSLLG